MEIPLEHLKITADNFLNVKVASIVMTDTTASKDDYLGDHFTKYHAIDLFREAQSFVDLPEKWDIAANTASEFFLTKGLGQKNLMLLVPANLPRRGFFNNDEQAMIVKAQFN